MKILTKEETEILLERLDAFRDNVMYGKIIETLKQNQINGTGRVFYRGSGTTIIFEITNGNRGVTTLSLQKAPIKMTLPYNPKGQYVLNSVDFNTDIRNTDRATIMRRLIEYIAQEHGIDKKYWDALEETYLQGNGFIEISLRLRENPLWLSDTYKFVILDSNYGQCDISMLNGTLLILE